MGSFHSHRLHKNYRCHSNAHKRIYGNSCASTVHTRVNTTALQPRNTGNASVLPLSVHSQVFKYMAALREGSNSPLCSVLNNNADGFPSFIPVLYSLRAAPFVYHRSTINSPFMLCIGTKRRRRRLDALITAIACLQKTAGSLSWQQFVGDIDLPAHTRANLSQQPGTEAAVH